MQAFSDLYMGLKSLTLVVKSWRWEYPFTKPPNKTDFCLGFSLFGTLYICLWQINCFIRSKEVHIHGSDMIGHDFLVNQ
jgi:hypothetical protein